VTDFTVAFWNSFGYNERNYIHLSSEI